MAACNSLELRLLGGQSLKSNKLLNFRILSICLVLLSLCACAGQRIVTGELEFGGEQVERIWPPSPEIPRYRYAGELTGEQNFHSKSEAVKSGAAKVLDWIVGLTSSRKESPIVLQRPMSGVVDEEGRIYVTDVSRKAVFVFDGVDGRLNVWDAVTQIGAPFMSPVGVALGADGQVLVADSELGVVVRLDREGRPLGFIGQQVLERPTGIARDPERGLIYVADTLAHNLKVFDDEGRLVETIGQRGKMPGEFNAPTHLTFADNKLYVTDTFNARIQVFDALGDQKMSLGHRGLFVGEFVRPKGIAVDSDDNIYVVESYHDHVLMYDEQGRFLMAIGGTGTDAGQFYLPAGVWIDSHDRIYVADMFNGRVEIFQFLGGSS